MVTSACIFGLNDSFQRVPLVSIVTLSVHLWSKW